MTSRTVQAISLMKRELFADMASIIGVAGAPGHRAARLTPVPCSSSLTDSVSDSRQAVLAAYVAMNGTGTKAEAEAMLSTRPRPCATIGGMKYDIIPVAAAIFRRIMAGLAAGSIFSKRPRSLMPALSTRMSIASLRRLSVVANLATSPSLARSDAMVDDLDAVAFDQLVAQHLELVRAARDQHEIMAGAGEAPCQRLADAHRGTGNENGFRGFSLPMTPPKFGGRIRR